MITWQSYSHFGFNVGYYYLIFLWNNIFFLIPTLICSYNWLQIFLVNGRCILGLKFITLSHSLSFIKIKQAFPFISHAGVFTFAKLKTDKNCLGLMLSTFKAGQFQILVSLSLTLLPSLIYSLTSSIQSASELCDTPEMYTLLSVCLYINLFTFLVILVRK